MITETKSSVSDVAVLYARLKEKGVTQRDLASMLDIIPPALSHWKRDGRIPSQQYMKLQSIASDYGVTLSPELFSWAKQK